LLLLFGHKRRRPENSGAQYEVADFGPESEVESIAMAAKVKLFGLFFLKENPFCNCLLGVIERMGGERGKQAGLKLWLLCLCFFVFVGLSFVVRCEVDSCSLHATFQSVRVLYLFFSFLIVILLDCFNCILRWLRALGF
jgi:hypothetical protein